MVQILKASIAVATAVDNYTNYDKAKKQTLCNPLTSAIKEFKCPYKCNGESNS